MNINRVSSACRALQVNGEVIETALRTFHASFGPAAARDCVLLVDGTGQPWDCGAARGITLQPKQLKQGERICSDSGWLSRFFACTSSRGHCVHWCSDVTPVRMFSAVVVQPYGQVHVNSGGYC